MPPLCVSRSIVTRARIATLSRERYNSSSRVDRNDSFVPRDSTTPFVNSRCSTQHVDIANTVPRILGEGLHTAAALFFAFLRLPPVFPQSSISSRISTLLSPFARDLSTLVGISAGFRNLGTPNGRLSRSLFTPFPSFRDRSKI